MTLLYTCTILSIFLTLMLKKHIRFTNELKFGLHTYKLCDLMVIYLIKKNMQLHSDENKHVELYKSELLQLI